MKQIKQAVQSVDSNAEIILFGSRARGEGNDESDWDFLILTEKSEGDFQFREKVRSVLFDLELSSGKVISTIIRNKDFWNDISVTPLYREVKKDGIVL